MPRAKKRITSSRLKIVMNVPPRMNGRRAVAPRNDQDLARPVLVPVPPQRSSLGHGAYHRASVDPIGAVEGPSVTLILLREEYRQTNNSKSCSLQWRVGS